MQTTNTTETQNVHPFAHLAPGPYRLIAVTDKTFEGRACTSCDACLTDIRWVYRVRAADGTEFVVGSECAQKIGLSAKEIRAMARAYRRERAEEAGRMSRAARIAAERAENLATLGVSLTNQEIRDAEVDGWNAAKRWLESERKVEARHVGAEGKRVKGTELRVDHVASWESQYGVTLLYILRDRAGNCLVWKTGAGLGSFEGEPLTRSEKLRPRMSRWFKADFTVKAHGEREGLKQTVVTRLTAKAATTEPEAVGWIRGLRVC